MKKFLIIISFVLIILASTVYVQAKPSDYIVDQSNTTTSPVSAIYNNSIVFWQSFTPTINNINQVDLYIRNFNVESPPPGIYLNVWINDVANVNTPMVKGNMTGASSIPMGQSAWLSTTLDLTMLNPYSQYYILFNISYFVSDDWFGIMVGFEDPDGPYLGGRGSSDPTGDFGFRTYYDSATAALPEIPPIIIPLLIPSLLISAILIKNRKK